MIVYNNNDKLLSICIPVFNRSNLLDRLLLSIDEKFKNDLELVIVDDGSTENIESVIKKYKEIFFITFIKQKNYGRGFALHKAIKNINSKFTMIMDSDDYFLKDSFYSIFENLKKKKEYKCFIFSTMTQKKIISIPDNLSTNFIELRADYKIKGDLKEIVETNILKNAINEVNIKYRRFPTQLLWTNIADQYECLSINTPIVQKNYLSKGITKNIFYYKIKYPLPMIELYKMLHLSSKYKSNFYRFKSAVFYYRYNFHAYGFSLKYININSLIGFIIYLFDRIYLNFKVR